ncbi:MAG: ATP-dependent DNA helicase RecG [Burkholderiaceae bacterium]|nr:ATP-dependent DNA helicase RecG [Burkholderiaceae bacterium]
MSGGPRASGGSTAAERRSPAERLGLKRDWDFLLHLPLRYIDETQVTPISSLATGAEQQVEGEVVACEVAMRGRRQLLVRLADAGGELLLRFFHFYPSTRRQLAVGRRVRAYGPVRGGLTGLEIVHPRVHAVRAGEPLPQRLTPVYPTAEGVSQSSLRARIARALGEVEITETVPADLLAAAGLPPLAEAIAGLHQPPAGVDAAALALQQGPWWERIRFDELLAQQISLRTARARRAERSAPPLAAGGPLTGRLLAALPFVLTGAQQRVRREIESDLSRAVPMQRLVQGDVGSGKTVLAALAAAQAIDAGCQAALMAPTEILAEQHFGRIAQWLAPLGVRVAWLAGKLKAGEKRTARQAAASGEAQLVIGTHALIQQAVKYADLGLAIVDEQHRFGVAQRLRLRSREGGAGRAPHLLMLSATPIPRTLAMSYYADLDVSVIDELPPGRQPVLTKLVSAARRDEVLDRVRAEAGRGAQAYWVCPLVSEGEGESTAELTAATAMYDATRALLPELRLGLLHGQLPPAEKTAVMRAFAAGDIDVLVATTVIEVGVDVPRATLMVIEHAQRFGLAQLHQLRGRVGRGRERSTCVLLYDAPLSEAARERLRVLYESSDGFEIARRDLQLRGPGEFLGARQSGVPLLRFADLERDALLLERSREAALQMLARHPQLAAAHVQRWLGARAEYLVA